MPTPTPSPGKAVVDIAYCGICGTDVHAYLSGDDYNPAICGHEWTGTVSALGNSVTNVKEGDRVAIGVASACGECPTCRRGDAEHCETAFAGAIGVGPMAAAHGGFASAIGFDATRLYKIDPSMSDEDAAILEPVTVAVHAVRRTDIRLGNSVVVIGGGPIGLLVLQAARAGGAGHLTLIEPERSRRELGKNLGADLVIDPTEVDVSELLNSSLAQQGADVVFECAGIPATIQHAVDYVRRGGVVSLVGVPNLPAQIDAATWLVKEVRLSTSLAYLHEEFEIAKGLVSDGRIRCAPLHTSTVSLVGLADAFAKLADQPSEVKILVDPRS
ncbi:MAG: alcohol dehydrogenase catalytic domain-containing protein [Gammaproteobacteria bacterium]|nr:alcohol dehydrogenase catalytic domain-containing protein [Gammaproteobacteria bacterium]